METSPEQRIPRSNIEVRISLGERALTLDYTNTELFLFPEPHDMIDHIYYHTENDNLYIFNSSKLILSLAQRGFPQNRRPWPSDGDIAVYEKYQAGVLEEDLKKLSPAD